MQHVFAYRSAVRGLVAAVVALLCSTGWCIAAEAAAPATGKLEVKTLLDQALADVQDAAAKQVVLRELDDVFPAQLKELQRTADSDGQAAAGTAAQLVGQAKHLVDLKQGDPREYERAVRVCRLENECVDLVQKARAAQGAAREPLLANLKKELGDLCDATQEELNREVATAAGELENRRRHVAKRAENRDLLIERRALEMLSDREAEW